MKKEIRKFVGEKIRYYRKKNGLTQKELGDKIGVRHNTISQYESGTNEPEQDMLFAIANILDVSVNEFFPNTEHTKEGFADSPLTVNEQPAEYGVTSVTYPFFPTAISAGLPINVEAITNAERIHIPESIMGKWSGSSDIFLTRVNGESMNRVIPDKSLIAIKPIELSNLKNGDIVVYSDGGDYSVKRYYRDEDRIIFRPDSDDRRFYDYITSIDNADLEIHGKVVVYVVELD